MPSVKRVAWGWNDRGAKNLRNLLGVTEGTRFSFRWLVRVGERKGVAGEEATTGGLEVIPSGATEEESS